MRQNKVNHVSDCRWTIAQPTPDQHQSLQQGMWDRCEEEAHLKQVVALELLVSPFEQQLDWLSQLLALQGGVLGNRIQRAPVQPPS